MKRMVYIAGPITKGDLAHNINQGTAAFIALAKAGLAPICPMWSAFSGQAMTASGGPYRAIVNLDTGLPVCTSVADITGKVFSVAGATPNELTHADWLAIDFEFISRCDALVRLPGDSVGADAEVAEANRLQIPVFRSVEEVIAEMGQKPLVEFCALCPTPSRPSPEFHRGPQSAHVAESPLPGTHC